jgi:hypothetical protein
LILSHRGKHLNNLSTFDVICQAQGENGFAQICYGGKAQLRGREDGYNGEVQNLYEAGASRNIARFYDCVVNGNFKNDTVQRSVTGALTTILGREAGLRRDKMTMDELRRSQQRLEVDLSGLRT